MQHHSHGRQAGEHIGLHHRRGDPEVGSRRHLGHAEGETVQVVDSHRAQTHRSKANGLLHEDVEEQEEENETEAEETVAEASARG